MKNDRSPESEDRLDLLLQAWKPQGGLPPRFREGVWRAIAHQEKTSAGFWRRAGDALLSWSKAQLTQPAGALAYVTFFILTGLGLGYWRAESYAHRAEAAWKTAYVHSINPAAVSLLR